MTGKASLLPLWFTLSLYLQTKSISIEHLTIKQICTKFELTRLTHRLLSWQLKVASHTCFVWNKNCSVEDKYGNQYVPKFSHLWIWILDWKCNVQALVKMPPSLWEFKCIQLPIAHKESTSKMFFLASYIMCGTSKCTASMHRTCSYTADTMINTYTLCSTIDKFVQPVDPQLSLLANTWVLSKKFGWKRVNRIMHDCSLKKIPYSAHHRRHQLMS